MLALFLAAALAAPPGQWTTHKDPLGFTVQVPPGWRVAGDQKTGRVDLTGPQQQQVIIWPVFVPQALDARGAGVVLGRMVAAAGVRASWGAPQPAGASAVRAIGNAGDRAAVSALTWANSSKGCAGYVYILSAPQAAYRQSAGTFAQILVSFSIAGAPPGKQPAAGGAPSYVRWDDPREHAFSLEVPAQWRVAGGLFRFASVDVRTAVTLDSPDGQMRITAGDAEIPTFTEPNQTLAFSGFREGMWYSPGYGTRFMVRRYLPGAVFVREYVTTRAAQGCSALSITDNRDRADAARSINATYAQSAFPGVQIYLTAGEVAFTCQKNSQAMAGYYFAGTQRTVVQGMGMWSVPYLYGFIVPEGKGPVAHQIIDRMLQTVRINPQWAAGQQNLTMATSRIVTETNNHISQAISDSYWSRQKVMDEISRRRSNATLGVVDVVDPATGQQYKVENSANYYWIDHRGVIVGTQTYTRPNIDFRELTQLP